MKKLKNVKIWGRTLAVFLLFPILLSASVKNSTATQRLEAFNMARTATTKMEITSPAFGMKGNIPEEFTCKSEDKNPPLEIENVPPETKSLALIMDDPDAPGGTFVHWVLWNISPGIKKIEAGSVPSGALQGSNSWGKNSYGGPCPPSGTHRYYFKLYALDTKLSLGPSAGKQELEDAMEGHTLAQSETIGLFKK